MTVPTQTTQKERGRPPALIGQLLRLPGAVAGATTGSDISATVSEGVTTLGRLRSRLDAIARSRRSQRSHRLVCEIRHAGDGSDLPHRDELRPETVMPDGSGSLRSNTGTESRCVRP